MTLPVFTKKISSAFSIVFKRWAIITRVVDSGSFFSMLSSSCSVTVSILAVASSSISNSGLRSTARMKAINCFCPKLMPSPVVCTFVSSPLSNRSSRLSSPASDIASDSCSFVKFLYPVFPYKMLSRTVPVNRKGS